MQSFAFSLTNPNAIMAAIRFRRTSSTRQNGFTTVSLEPNKIKGLTQWGAFSRGDLVFLIRAPPNNHQTVIGRWALERFGFIP
jgi:hypothetical protein